MRDMDNISLYAFDLISKACCDIEENDISPSPLVLGADDPCKNCKFFALCRFDEKFCNTKRNPNTSIDAKSFDFFSDVE